MKAFARAFAAYPSVPAEWSAGLNALGPDERVPVSKANEMLEIAVAQSGDPYLALKAGRLAQRGDAGALDYVITTSATVLEALEAACRYIRLVNDALEMQLVVEGESVSVKLISSVTPTPEVEDFALASFYTNCVRPLIGDAPELQVAFIRRAPGELREHQDTFPNAALRFRSSWSGYRFAMSRLHERVPTADSSLHAILRSQLERTLSETPSVDNITERARQLIRRELPHGRATAPNIARAMSMSRRTLCRRLEDEHTTFTDLLDEVRRTIALDQVARGQLALSEIAFLLGFAQVAGFHRAFKRWTGKTPVEYRQAQG